MVEESTEQKTGSPHKSLPDLGMYVLIVSCVIDGYALSLEM